MPIYEYRCPNGHTFEVFQRMADPPVETCERCGAGPVEKLLFPVAVHFKGSGFYSTDYGRGGRKAGKEGDGGSSGDSGSGGDSGSSSADTSDKGSKDSSGEKSSSSESKKPPSKDA